MVDKMTTQVLHFLVLYTQMTNLKLGAPLINTFRVEDHVDIFVSLRPEAGLDGYYFLFIYIVYLLLHKEWLKGVVRKGTKKYHFFLKTKEIKGPCRDRGKAMINIMRVFHSVQIYMLHVHSLIY